MWRQETSKPAERGTPADEEHSPARSTTRRSRHRDEKDVKREIAEPSYDSISRLSTSRKPRHQAGFLSKLQATKWTGMACNSDVRRV